MGEQGALAAVDGTQLGFQDGYVNVLPGRFVVRVESEGTDQTGPHRGNGSHRSRLVESNVTAQLERFAIRQAGGVHLSAHAIEKRFRSLDNRGTARFAQSLRCWCR